MHKVVREEFAMQADAATLAQVRELAEAEGRQLQSLVEKALADLLERRRKGRPRDHVMRAYRRGHGPCAELYKTLAS